MKKKSQIQLFVLLMMVVGFTSVTAIANQATQITSSEQAALSPRLLEQRLLNSGRQRTLILVSGGLVVFAATGLALGVISPYEREDLVRGATNALIGWSLLSVVAGQRNFLALFAFVITGVGIIYAIGQRWADRPTPTRTLYLGLIQLEDGSLAEVEWMRQTGRINLRSAKTSSVEPVGFAKGYQEAQAFFQRLRHPTQTES